MGSQAARQGFHCSASSRQISDGHVGIVLVEGEQRQHCVGQPGADQALNGRGVVRAEYVPRRRRCLAESVVDDLPASDVAGADHREMGDVRDAYRSPFRLCSVGWCKEHHGPSSKWVALRPYAIGIGSYVNGMAEFEEDRVRASYGAAKYQRLATIKAEYDPDNVFQRNANIKPSLTHSSTTKATVA
jgi:Berberine and berberine like